MTSFFCQEIRSAHVSVALWIPLKWRLHVSHAVSFFNTSSPVLHLKFWRILDLLLNQVWQPALPPLSFPFPFTSPFRPLPASCHNQENPSIRDRLAATISSKSLQTETPRRSTFPQLSFHPLSQETKCCTLRNWTDILLYVTIIHTKCIDFRMRNSPRSPCSNRVWRL